LDERVYRDICLADQFPFQRWSNDRPSALLSKLDAARPGAADPSPTILPSRSPANTTAPTGEAPASAASIELADLKNHMLELINGDRQANGLDLVTLGDNPAAQEHAEEMSANGYLSHWGMDGMKPYMRYTLAGGVNYEGENASGVITSSWLDVLARAVFPEEQLRETQQALWRVQGIEGISSIRCTRRSISVSHATGPPVPLCNSSPGNTLSSARSLLSWMVSWSWLGSLPVVFR